MIRPALQNDGFLRDVRTAGEQEPDALHLWWLGQSGFLVQNGSRHLLLDPYLSDSLTKKYAGTDKPHVRLTERVVDPSRLGFVDVATSSHCHTDHLDAETLKPLMAANPNLKLVASEANRELIAERLGVDASWPVGANDGRTIDVDGWGFTGIAAAHETVERDARGNCKFLGFVVQIERRPESPSSTHERPNSDLSPTGCWTLYHSGDTVLYDGLVDSLRTWNVDVALLPINGRAPERRVEGNLDGAEAARLSHDIGARLVIPCHYEMFEFNTASPQVFATECQRLGQPYRVLRCGERCKVS